MIAGLPRAPSSFDPFVSPTLALQRRNEVLAAMLADASITQAQYAWAVRQPLGIEPGSIYNQIKEPPFFGYVQDQLLAKLGPKLPIVVDFTIEYQREPAVLRCHGLRTARDVDD